MTKKRRPQDRSSATYLDRLGHESARAYTFVISVQAAQAGLKLPLPDADVEQLLHNTIVGLEEQGRLAWASLPAERQSVFINAWVDEMNKLGVRR